VITRGHGSHAPSWQVAVGWRLRVITRGHGSPAPFWQMAACWLLRICNCAHGETFLSDERRLAAGLRPDGLWSRCRCSRQPAVPADRGVPERGEAFPDAGLGGALVALGGPAWPGRGVRGSGQRPGGLAGGAERHVLRRLRHVDGYPEDTGGQR